MAPSDVVKWDDLSIWKGLREFDAFAAHALARGYEPGRRRALRFSDDIRVAQQSISDNTSDWESMRCEL